MSSQGKSQRVHFQCLQEDQKRLQEQTINYHFNVKGTIAYHNLQIEYVQNQTDSNKLYFQFTLSEDTCFDHLQIDVDGNIIQCVVKEKEEAKQEYDQAISKGRTAAYGNLEDRGYFKIDIGNVILNKKITISFKYIEQLKAIGNYYLMDLPFKYYTDGKQFSQLNLTGDIYSQNEKEKIVSTELINCVNKKKVKYEVISQNHTSLKASYTDNISEQENKDERNMLALKIQFQNTSSIILSSYQNDSEISPYCALATYVPHLNNLVKDNDTNQDLIKSEFIVILDRSGSMSGTRIQMAKEALIFFLKSLPVDSIYNIISFGSNYEFMYDSSVQFNDENIQDSISKVETFTANMGGTYIGSALKQVFSTLQDQYGLRKKIYVMTDGDFSDYEEAEKITKKYKERCDLNILAIGSDLNMDKISKFAQITSGKYEQVVTVASITQSVILLLKSSFEGYRAVTMKIESDNDECINYIVPDPSQIKYIDKTKTLRFYIFLNRNLEQTKKINFNLITSYNSKNTLKDQLSINIDEQIPNEEYHIHKMGLYAMIRQVIVNKQRKSENIMDDILCAIKNNEKKQIELFKNEAIRYQILCEYTAFIGQLKEEVKNQQQEQDIILYSLQLQNQQLIRLSSSFNSSVSSKRSINLSGGMKMSANSFQRKDAAGCCGGGSSGSYSSNSKKYKASEDDNDNIIIGNQQSYPSQSKQQQQNTNSINLDNNQKYNKIIQMQSVSGLWKYTPELLKLLSITEDNFNKYNPIDASTCDEYKNIWMSLIVIYWLDQYQKASLDKHQYVLLKALGTTDRLKKQYDIQSTDQELKNIFQDYKI